MTTADSADRVNLSSLVQHPPPCSTPQSAQMVGRALSWVKKWKRLLKTASTPADLEALLRGRACAPKPPPARVDPLVEEPILTMRDHPPEGLRRTPGPKAIQEYLARDPSLQCFTLPVPGTSTIYRILKKQQRIGGQDKPRHEPFDRPAPLSQWQLACKDISSVPADPEGKRRHVVEACDRLDVGTSILLDAHVRTDLTAEIALGCVVESEHSHGLPHKLPLDRDPRWVGNARGSAVPAALVRLCRCLGVEVEICDPEHPEQNGCVARDHRTSQQDWLLRDRPRTLQDAREGTARLVDHYNRERPHQAKSCGNHPRLQAFPHLPQFPPVPSRVDPESWLVAWQGWHVERKVDQLGTIRSELKRSGVGRRFMGLRVTVTIDAPTHSLHSYHGQQVLKTVPLKGIGGRKLSFEEFVTPMQQQAQAEQRLRAGQERQRRMAKRAFP